MKLQRVFTPDFPSSFPRNCWHNDERNNYRGGHTRAMFISRRLCQQPQQQQQEQHRQRNNNDKQTNKSMWHKTHILRFETVTARVTRLQEKC